jgi:hypothetical protein
VSLTFFAARQKTFWWIWKNAEEHVPNAEIAVQDYDINADRISVSSNELLATSRFLEYPHLQPS